jgi:hypothetical protein
MTAAEFMRLAVSAIDWEPLFRKLTHTRGSARWSEEYTMDRLTAYRRFLYLKKSFPDLPLGPSKSVDVVWHTHILQTKRYFDDSTKLLGFVLHHYDLFGIDETSDETDLRRSRDLVEKLEFESFGDVLIFDQILRISELENSGPFIW